AVAVAAVAVAEREGGDPSHQPCCDAAGPTPAVARQRAITLSVLDTLLEAADTALADDSGEGRTRARVALAAADRILGPPPRTVALGSATTPAPTVGTFRPLPAPLNPRLLRLYELVADRRTLLTHRDPPWPNRSADDGGCHRPDPYRFTFRLQKTLELNATLRTLAGAWLAAQEKGDAEHLAARRAMHERELLHLALSVRKDQWREADWQVQALEVAKTSAQQQVVYYTGLLSPPPLGLIAGETTYQSLTESALGTQIASQVLEIVGQAGALMPDVFADGIASGSTIPGVGRKFTDIFHTLATATGYLAQDLVTDAGLNLTEAGWERRRQEWAHLRDINTIDVERIERLKLAAERTRSRSHKEVQNHQRQIEHLAEVADIHRDKFSGEGLYLALQPATVGLFRQTYELVVSGAEQTQRQFNIERGHTDERFVHRENWVHPRDGLLAAERLELGLRRMEKAFLDRNHREYEITKHISLRLHFPAAYLRLRNHGICEFDIPEWLHDLYSPGSFMRRIVNVGISTPCVAGAYTGVHCRLTLLRSETRIDPRLRPPAEHCCDDCADRDDGYEACRDDPRVVRQYGAVEAIITSSGQADSGMFEAGSTDVRRFTYQDKGAAGRWRIEIPQENNQFDLDTLADVVLHLRYTAREGGDALRRAANAAAQRHLPGDGVRFFDARADFPDSWALLAAERAGGERHRELPLRMSRDMFPFLPGRRPVRIHRLDLFFSAPEAAAGGTRYVEFLVGHRPGHAGECRCRRVRVACVAADDWPGLFHGVVTADLPELDGDTYREVGTVRFEHGMGPVERMFLCCGYTADRR
ncbi:MAG: neuraminidase-like domain-containing protein, partial [Frankia sp.]